MASDDDPDTFNTLAAQKAAFEALGFDLTGMTPSCIVCGVAVTSDQMQLHHDWHTAHG